MTEEMLPPERTSRKITSSGQIKSRGGQKLEPIGVSDDTAAWEKNFN